MGRILCIVCQKRCRGDTLKVGQNYLHRECFKCCVCYEALEKKVYCQHPQSGNTFYCLEDYQRQYGTRCCACQEVVVGDAVTVFGKTFHQNCFKCRDCGITFNNGDRTTLCDGQYLCIPCFEQVQARHRQQVECTTAGPSSSSIITNNCGESGGGGDVPLSSSSHHTNGGHPQEEEEEEEEGEEGKGRSEHEREQPRNPVPRGTPSTAVSAVGRSPHVSHHWLQYNLTSDSEGISTDSAFEGVPGRMEHAITRPSVHQHYHPPEAYSSSISECNSPYYPRHSAGVSSSHHQYSTSNHQPTSTLANQNIPISRRRHKSVGPQEHGYVRPWTQDFGRFYMNQNYLQLESDQESSSTMTSPRNRYRRIIASGGTLTHQSATPIPTKKDTRSLAPASSPHFHRPPDRPFSYRHPSPLLHNTKQRVSVFHQFRHLSNGHCAGSSIASHDEEEEDDHATGHDSGTLPPHPARESECPESVEPRRLALFPGGHEPDPGESLAIERSDWPAPPSPAVMLMERIRQKHASSWANQRSQSLQMGLHPTDMVDHNMSAHSPSHRMNGRSARIRCDSEKMEKQEQVLAEAASSNSGIAQALIQEMRSNGERRSPSPELNPISSSRCPNANQEPELKQRYERHSFASPSRDTRRERALLHYVCSPMEYTCTGGRWRNTPPSCPNTPRPGESLGSAYGGGGGMTSSRGHLPGNPPAPSPYLRFKFLPHQHTAISEASILQRLHAAGTSLPQNVAPSDYLQWSRLPEEPNGGGATGDASSSCCYETTIDPQSPRQSRLIFMRNGVGGARTPAAETTDEAENFLPSPPHTQSLATLSARDSLAAQLSLDANYPMMLSVQSWLKPTGASLWLTSNAYKTNLPPPKIYSYESLIKMGDTMRDVDPAKREYHLSEEEFKRVFQMNRDQFTKLPVWKQMDLKKRVGLL